MALNQLRQLNVQNQQRIEWPRKLVIAKAYLDQLERSQALPADRIAALRQEIQKAERSKLSAGDRGKLKSEATSVESSAVSAKNEADAARLRGLAGILNQPSL